MRGQRLPDPLKSYTPPVKEGPSSEKDWALQEVTKYYTVEASLREHTG